MITLDNAAKFLIQNNNYLVFIHDNADGDCFGSALALCRVLKLIGKKAAILSPSPIPKRLAFFNQQNDVEVFVGVDGYESAKEKYSTPISVDIASDKLMGKVSEAVNGKIQLAIDHHSVNTLTAEKMYVDSESPAAGQIIFELVDALSGACKKPLLTKDVADALYGAIASDTGCFKYSSVEPNTHIACAVLIQAGADFANINYRLFDVKTQKQIKVETLAYKHLELHHQNRLAFIYIPQQELDAIDAVHEDTENVCQIARTVDGVQVGVYMYEKAPGTFKFSVRSNNNCDMAALCAHFGGGGHMKAAGCTIDANDTDAIKLFVEKAKEYLE